MKEDLEHLRLLSVFHYIVGGLAALFSLVPVLHLVIGLGLATGTFEDATPIARNIGCFFVFFASLIILLGLAFAVCLVLAGRFLAAQRHYTFCLVMAALACVFMPFGTVLGIFTILVLMRPSARALFEGRAAEAEASPGG